jgi:hypothetical protein
MGNTILLAAYQYAEIKAWPEDKKAWVRLEAQKLAAKGIAPDIQELGMAYPIKK